MIHYKTQEKACFVGSVPLEGWRVGGLADCHTAYNMAVSLWDLHVLVLRILMLVTAFGEPEEGHRYPEFERQQENANVAQHRPLTRSRACSLMVV